MPRGSKKKGKKSEENAQKGATINKLLANVMKAPLASSSALNMDTNSPNTTITDKQASGVAEHGDVIEEVSSVSAESSLHVSVTSSHHSSSTDDTSTDIEVLNSTADSCSSSNNEITSNCIAPIADSTNMINNIESVSPLSATDRSNSYVSADEQVAHDSSDSSQADREITHVNFSDDDVTSEIELEFNTPRSEPVRSTLLLNPLVIDQDLSSITVIHNETGNSARGIEMDSEAENEEQMEATPGKHNKSSEVTVDKHADIVTPKTEQALTTTGMSGLPDQSEEQADAQSDESDEFTDVSEQVQQEATPSSDPVHVELPANELSTDEAQPDSSTVEAEIEDATTTNEPRAQPTVDVQSNQTEIENQSSETTTSSIQPEEPATVTTLPTVESQIEQATVAEKIIPAEDANELNGLVTAETEDGTVEEQTPDESSEQPTVSGQIDFKSDMIMEQSAEKAEEETSESEASDCDQSPSSTSKPLEVAQPEADKSDQSESVLPKSEQLESAPIKSSQLETTPAKYVQSEALQTTPDQLEVTETTPGQSEVAHTSPGHPGVPQTTPDQSEVARTTLGQSEVAQTTPGQSEVAQTAPGQSEVTQTAPGQSEVALTNPGQSEVTTTTPVQSEVIHTAPDRPEVPQTTPDQSEVTKATPGRSEVAQATPGQSEVAQATPGQSEVAQTTPGQSEVALTNPGQSEVTQTTPGQSEWQKPDVIQTPDKQAGDVSHSEVIVSVKEEETPPEIQSKVEDDKEVSYTASGKQKPRSGRAQQTVTPEPGCCSIL